MINDIYNQQKFQILHIEDVKNYSHLHLWQLKSNVNVASVHVEIDNNSNEQIVRQKVVALLRKYNATQSTVQVEKSQFTTSISHNRHHFDGSEVVNGQFPKARTNGTLAVNMGT